MKISVTLSDLHDINVDLLALAFSKADLKKRLRKRLLLQEFPPVFLMTLRQLRVK